MYTVDLCRLQQHWLLWRVRRQAAMEWIATLLLLLVGCSSIVVVNGNNITSFPVASGICTNATCRYELTVTEYESMMIRDAHLLSRMVYLNGTVLQVTIEDFTKTVTPDEVITADGQSRQIILINGQFPGPTIEVLAGAQVVVKVINNLFTKPITVHWHGIRQFYTYHMDGVAYITQCPIPAGQSFTYSFLAEPNGTHWYHSHVAELRIDGLAGMLIVHPSVPTIPYHSMMVEEWNQFESDMVLIRSSSMCENGATGPPYESPKSDPDCTFEGAELYQSDVSTVMIGGRNRHDADEPYPLNEYVLRTGQLHRFRLVHKGNMAPIEISIDGHYPLTIVASDGSEIEPIEVDSFFIQVAESIDFVFAANQTPGRYWMRADSQCEGRYGRAIIAYEGFETRHDDPVSESKNCTGESPCVVFNCPFGRYPDGYNKTCISLEDANSTLSSQELIDRFGVGNTTENVTEYILNFANNAGASINGRMFAMPSEPLSQNTSAGIACVGAPCLDGCKCRCTNILEVPLGTTLQLVITNYQPDPDVETRGYHSIHIHGYQFAVLAKGYPTYNHTTGLMITPNEELTCDNDLLCTHPHWIGTPPDFSDNEHPVIKDTVALPYRGYLVLRFRTMNPGFWAFHCHHDTHAAVGMKMVIKVAPELVPTPVGFPLCYDTSDFQPIL